jgi:hypothetical protein
MRKGLRIEQVYIVNSDRDVAKVRHFCAAYISLASLFHRLGIFSR